MEFIFHQNWQINTIKKQKKSGCIWLPLFENRCINSLSCILFFLLLQWLKFLFSIYFFFCILIITFKNANHGQKLQEPQWEEHIFCFSVVVECFHKCSVLLQSRFSKAYWYVPFYETKMKVWKTWFGHRHTWTWLIYVTRIIEHIECQIHSNTHCVTKK